LAHIALFATYNPTKASQVGEVFNQQAKLRASGRIMKTIFGPIDWLDQDGGHSLTVLEVEDNKCWDGLFELSLFMRPYIAIEGYRYETKFVVTQDDQSRFRKMVAEADARAKK